MNIQNATKEALEKGCFIARESLKGSKTVIKPTNTYDCCIIMVKGKESQQSRFWNPTADDLIAEDWKIVME